MPELPEVETMVRGIRPFVSGRKLTAIRQCRTKCRPITMTPRFATIAKRLHHRTVQAVRRLGKRVLFEFEDELTLVIEPRMTGLVLLADPPDSGHLRFVLEFEDQREYNSVWFWDRRGLGTVRFFGPGELGKYLGSHPIGPDALTIPLAEFQSIFSKTGRAIKVALLDQQAMAGVGNLYASEILHVAGLHPMRTGDSLSDDEFRRLHAAVHEVLEEAIRYEGSTLGDGTYRNALNQAGTYQNLHRVYQKHDQTCTRCLRGVIERTVQAQRSTFYCPSCQR